VTGDFSQRHRARDLSRFDWRDELRSLAVGVAWVLGIMAIWFVLVQI
jgi:hypothetical protein